VRAGYTDTQIAETLSQEGFRSARRDRVLPKTILKIRNQHHWVSRYHQHRLADKIDGMWTIHGLSRHLGVEREWFYHRIRTGTLREPDVIRKPPYGNYLLRDDAALLARLRTEVNRSPQLGRGVVTGALSPERGGAPAPPVARESPAVWRARTSRTNPSAQDASERHKEAMMGTPQEHRRHQAIARYLAGDPIETICRELHCAKSWLYKWKARYQADDPGWAMGRSTQPRHKPRQTPQLIAEARRHLASDVGAKRHTGGVLQRSNRASNSKGLSRSPRCARFIASCSAMQQRRISNATQDLPRSMTLWYSSRGHEAMARSPVDRVSST